jgi:heme A synthase
MRCVNILLSLHNLNAWLVEIAGGLTLIVGVIWLVLYRGKTVAASDPVDQLRRYFRYGLIATFALGALQAILGGLLFLLGERPANVLHYVYGLLVLALIPVVWVYSDQNRVRRDIIIMSIAVFAVVAAGVRAFMTGPVPH